MKDIFLGNKRILILQNIDKNITLSNEMLQRALRAYGHSLGVTEVTEILVWLSERNLVDLEPLSDTIVTAKLTRQGRDIARGYARFEGIDDPVED